MIKWKLYMKTTSTMNQKTINWWDWTGIFLSGLCLIHCILTPLLLATTLVWVTTEWVHITLLLILVPIVFIAARRSGSSYDRRVILALFSAGILFLAGAVFVGESLGRTAELLLTIIGSLLLITGHLKNRC